MQWKMEKRWVRWGFAAAEAILVFAGWETYRNTTRFAEAAETQRRSYELVQVLDETQTRLVDAETGQRGFLLTGDEAYLEPYRAAIKNLDQDLARLKNLFSDNPNRQAQVQSLEPLVENKLAELQMTIDLRRKEGIAAANEVVLEGSGKHWMDQIRAVVADLKNEQDQDRRIRTQEMHEIVVQTGHTIVIGYFFSLSLLVFIFVLLDRELRERKRAQEALGKSERWLSTTLGSIGDAVIATDLNGAVTFMNPVAQSLTGWSLAEAQGKSMDLVFDIVNRETRRPVENPVKKVFREGKIVGLADHTLLLSKDGRQFDIEDSAAPILADTGEGFGVVLVFRDITEKKRAEDETKRQKELLQLILESIADGVVVADSNGKFLLFNAAAEQIVGIGATDTTPNQWSDRYGSYLSDGVTPYPPSELPLVRAMRGERIDAEEIFIRNAKVPDGRLLSITGSPLRGEDGSLRGGVVVFCDVTERKRAEQSLRLSEERYRLLFESNPHPVWVYDLESLAIIDVNEAAIRNYGYSREEFLTLTIKDIRPAEDVPAVLQSVAKSGNVLEENRIWRHCRKNGTLLDVEVTSHPLVYAGRNARLVVSTDITKRKQAEEALKASEQRLNLALDAAQLGIWELDLVNDKAYRNLRHDQIFGYESLQPDWGYEIFLTHVVTEDRDTVKKSFENAFATGNFGMECRVIWADKSIHWISAQGRVFRNDKGDPVKMMGTVSDVTERKRAEEAIVRAKEEAERSNKFKDQFLSTMSHELRTPLNAVLGFSDLLTEERYGPLNDRQRRYINHIHTGGKHLLRLINDILDLSKIEAGRLQLAIESVPVKTSFAEVVDTMRPLSDRKSQSLVVNISLDLSVRADATRFKQVLMNLIGNAIKFTPEGGKIELSAQQLGDAIRVEVRDTGPGIPAEEQQRIFEAFYQSTQTGKAVEGTGLGLAITQRLVELHGGHLGLESQPGSGSCFYFTLPVVPTFQREEEMREAGSGLGTGVSQRILVIEDDSSAAQLLQSQLASSGYEVVLCDARQRAVEMAAELRPDAITLDIMMKPVSGWELLSNLKSDPRTSQIPVIVVTIVDQPSTGALLGADEYIVKPVEKSMLLASVRRCLSHGRNIGKRQPILVVEDDNPTREFIAELLSQNGYDARTAVDGADARAQVAASLPELVILDLILPKVSGFQLLSEWRINSQTADLPVFVLTSKDLTREEKDYLGANTKALFHKQERWQEALVAQLRRTLSPLLTEQS